MDYDARARDVLAQLVSESHSEEDDVRIIAAALTEAHEAGRREMLARVVQEISEVVAKCRASAGRDSEIGVFGERLDGLAARIAALAEKRDG